jgi:hypothetical protein
MKSFVFICKALNIVLEFVGVVGSMVIKVCSFFGGVFLDNV